MRSLSKSVIFAGNRKGRSPVSSVSFGKFPWRFHGRARFRLWQNDGRIESQNLWVPQLGSYGSNFGQAGKNFTNPINTKYKKSTKSFPKFVWLQKIEICSVFQHKTNTVFLKILFSKFHLKMSFENVIRKCHLKMSFVNLIWKCHLKISFENLIWKSHLGISFGNLIWKSHLKISFENVIWKSHLKISFENLIWKSHLKISFENHINVTQCFENFLNI